jgi:phage baseplate assembly protein W
VESSDAAVNAQESDPVINDAPSPAVGGFGGRLSGYVAEALRFWEPRRLVYNATLAAVVLGHYRLALARRSRKTLVQLASRL